MISVIIPTFNSQDTIERAIFSIKNQDYRYDLEIIIVDDASQDNTLKILKQFNLPEVKIIALSENSGAGIARNHGLDFATGNYVAFLDADDFWLPGKLRQQLRILKNFPDVDVVSSGIAYMDTKKPHANSFKLRAAKGRIDFHSRWKMLYKNDLSTSTVICRSSAINKIRFRNLRMRQDWVFWWDLIQSGKSILLHPGLTAVYDTSVKGISNDFIKARKYDFFAIKLMTERQIMSSVLFVLMMINKVFVNFLFPQTVSKDILMRLINYDDKTRD